MPEAITLGPLLLPTRILQLVLGCLLASWLLGIFSKRSTLDRRQARRILESGLVFGLIGARASFVVINWAAYLEAPWSAIFLWQPGYDPIAGFVIGAVYSIWRIWRLDSIARPIYLRATLMALTVTATVIIGTNVVANRLADPDRLRAGDQFPNFALQSVDGGTVRLSDFAEQPVVLNFWATWCPPCRREMPLLNSVHLQFADEGLVVLGIAVAESVALVRAFRDESGVDYPILVDSEGDTPSPDTSSALLARLGPTGLPTTVFLNKEGVIQRIYVGELSRGFLFDQILPLPSG